MGSEQAREDKKRPHEDNTLFFSDKDLEGVQTPHQDSLVI